MFSFSATGSQAAVQRGHGHRGQASEDPGRGQSLGTLLPILRLGSGHHLGRLSQCCPVTASSLPWELRAALREQPLSVPCVQDGWQSKGRRSSCRGGLQALGTQTRREGWPTWMPAPGWACLLQSPHPGDRFAPGCPDKFCSSFPFIAYACTCMYVCENAWCVCTCVYM